MGKAKNIKELKRLSKDYLTIGDYVYLFLKSMVKVYLLSRKMHLLYMPL